jgi:hypothetical protein
MKKRVYILVKAYPQPIQQYEETVCCAGVTEDGKQFLRLYPIPYRRLRPEQRFERYDLCEMTVWRDTKDFRLESHKVDPDSIRIIRKGKYLKDEQKPKLWLPFVAESLDKLKQDNVAFERSLGIVRPNKQSVKFFWKQSRTEIAEDKSIYQQMSLYYDKPLKPLVTDYSFGYRFISGKTQHEMKIHDWEVQATYHKYRRRYGDDVLNRMSETYNEKFNNLHFIMGTMKAHPRQFIIVGLLRTSVDLKQTSAQDDIFQ